MTVDELVQKYIDRYEPLVVQLQRSEGVTQQDFEQVMEVLGHRASLPIWHDDTDGFVSDITDVDLIREASPVVQGELNDMIIDVASWWARKQAVKNAASPEQLRQHDTQVLAHRFEKRILRLEKRGRVGAKYNAMRVVRDALLGALPPQDGIAAVAGYQGEIWRDALEVLNTL